MNTNIEIQRDRLIGGKYFEEYSEAESCAACTLGQYMQQQPGVLKEMLNDMPLIRAVRILRNELDELGVPTELLEETSDSLLDPDGRFLRADREARIVKMFARGGITATFVGEYL